MSDDLEFIVIDDIPEYIFCIGDDEENERVIALSGKDGAFKYEKVAELPTTGEDGVLYLVPKSHTTQTASGNPINVNITDNAGKIESLKLDGDTYQQTYTGKNLYYDTDGYAQGFIGDGGVVSSSTNSVTNATYIKVSENTQYVMSFNTIVSETTLRGIGCYDSNKGFISRIVATSITNNSFQTVAGTAYIRVYFYNANGLDATNFPTNYISDIQLELGSTPTSGYEPYVGGLPSPNPSYPQPVQTVTGEQTISINGTDHEIDLGSIELCKLGTYQDYIYKNGEDWKIHKEMSSRTFNGSETNWVWNNSIGGYDYCRAYIELGDNYVGSGRQRDLSNYFHYQEQEHAEGICFTSYKHAYFYPFRDIDTLDKFKTWLSTHNTDVYYALATATDTTITDATLIAQLEAVRTAALSTGSNTISNTATGTNLAGDLEIGYYGYDPLNKYDKYFWLDVDGAYESL